MQVDGFQVLRVAIVYALFSVLERYRAWASGLFNGLAGERCVTSQVLMPVVWVPNLILPKGWAQPLPLCLKDFGASQVLIMLPNGVGSPSGMSSGLPRPESSPCLQSSRVAIDPFRSWHQ